MSAKIPLGIFWDIENCPIPSNKEVSSVVKEIRNFVGERHPECGFPKVFDCACDSSALAKHTTDSLNNNGVTVIHVNSTAKNTADYKLQELIDVFIDSYGDTGSAVVCVITSDKNFGKQIRRAQRKDLQVLLIYGPKSCPDLKNSVTESYSYEDIVQNADQFCATDSRQKTTFLRVSNLPMNRESEDIRKRLSQLSDNCGGRPQKVENGRALIWFACAEDAERCLTRINGQNVFGNNISVSLNTKKKASKQTNNKSQQNSVQSRDLSEDRDFCRQKMNNSMNTDSSMSVLKGLFTRKNDDLLDVVRNLVDSWNDPYIKPEFVCEVKTSYKRNRTDGKHNLFVRAVSDQGCSALVNGALRHFKDKNGLAWEHFTKTNLCESFIEGLVVKRGQDLTKFVKQLVLDWNDPDINPNAIEKVISDSRDGKQLLVVTATSPHNSKALVSGAKKYLNTESGIKWFFTRHLEQESETTGSLRQVMTPNMPQMSEKRARQKSNQMNAWTNSRNTGHQPTPVRLRTGSNGRFISEETSFQRQSKTCHRVKERSDCVIA